MFAPTKQLLLRCAGKITHLCCDATYKVTVENLPLLIIGTTSFKKFYPLAAAIIRNEKTTTYQFAFQSLKDSYFELIGEELLVDTIMADAADSIFNGFKKFSG